MPRGISTSTTITPSRTWGFASARRSTRRWATSWACGAMPRPVCHWRRPWRQQYSTFVIALTWCTTSICSPDALAPLMLNSSKLFSWVLPVIVAPHCISTCSTAGIDTISLRLSLRRLAGQRMRRPGWSHVSPVCSPPRKPFSEGETMLAIVDYGRGNLWSVQNGFAQVGAPVQISADPDIIRRADAVVFPGVGAFRDCMHNLEACGLDRALHEVLQAGKPVLAICVGMQALLSESEEFGLTPGLGIFEGQVRRFPDTVPASTSRLKVPHMGWNQLQQQRACPLLAGIPDGTFAYFVHSYYAAPKDAAAVVATTDYGVEFASVLWRDNLYATQFHPEKSQHWGLRILQNFFNLSHGKGGR